MYENSESCLYLMFKNVPKDKLPQIKPKLLGLLRNIVEKEDIDMKRMTSIINRRKLECLSKVENSPHHTIAFSIIGHMLYGNTKEDVRGFHRIKLYKFLRSVFYTVKFFINCVAILF